MLAKGMATREERLRRPKSANPFENLVEGNPFDEVAPPRSGVDNPFAGVFDTASCGSLASVDEQQEVAKSHLGRGGSQESI